RDPAGPPGRDRQRGTGAVGLPQIRRGAVADATDDPPVRGDAVRRRLPAGRTAVRGGQELRLMPLAVPPHDGPERVAGHPGVADDVAGVVDRTGPDVQRARWLAERSGRLALDDV